jgi:anaerobic carbon-monoxide dehydrogenase iron sulfur subunit
MGVSTTKQDTVNVIVFHPEKCIGCLACEKACSKVHFQTGDGGERSAIRVSGEKGAYKATVCNQCGLCMDMCSVGALTRNKKGVVALDAKLCVGCQMCVAFCPASAMRKAPARLEPFKCISCGSCVRACPEHALELAEKSVDDLKKVVYHRLGA